MAFESAGSSNRTVGRISKSTSSSRKRRRRTRKQDNTAEPSSMLTDIVGNTISTCTDIIASEEPQPHGDYSARQSRFDGHRLRNLLRFHHDSCIKLDQVRQAQWNTNKKAKSQLPLSPRSFSDSSRNATPSFPKDSMLDAILKTTSPPPTGRISLAPGAATLSPSSATSTSVVALPTILDGKNQQLHHAWPTSITLIAPLPISRVKGPLSRHANPSSLAAITELARRYVCKVGHATPLPPRDDAIASDQYQYGSAGVDPYQTSYANSGAFASPSPSSAITPNVVPVVVSKTSRERVESPNSFSTLSHDEDGKDRINVTEHAMVEKRLDSDCGDPVGPLQSLSSFLGMRFGNRFANSINSTADLKREAQQAPSQVVITTNPSAVHDNEELSIDSLCMPPNANKCFTPGADFLLQLGHILGKSSYALTTPIQHLMKRCEIRQNEEVGMMRNGYDEDDDQYTTSSLSAIVPRRIVPERRGRRKKGTSAIRLLLAVLLISTGYFMMGLHYTILAVGNIYFRKAIAQIIGNGRDGNRPVVLDQSLSMTIDNEVGLPSDEAGLKCSLVAEEEKGKEAEEMDGLVDKTTRSNVSVSGDILHGLVDDEILSLTLPIRRMATVAPVAHEESMSKMNNESKPFAWEGNFDEECKQETPATCIEAYDFTADIYSYNPGLYFATDEIESNLLSLDEHEQSLNETTSTIKAPPPQQQQHFGKRIPFMPSRNASIGLRSASAGVESTFRGLVVKHSMPEVGVLVPYDWASSFHLYGLRPATMFPASEAFALLDYQGFALNECSRRDHDRPTPEMFDVPLIQLLGQMITDYRSKKHQKKLLRRLALNNKRIDEAMGNSQLRRLSPKWLKRFFPSRRSS